MILLLANRCIELIKREPYLRERTYNRGIDAQRHYANFAKIAFQDHLQKADWYVAMSRLDGENTFFL